MPRPTKRSYRLKEKKQSNKLRFVAVFVLAALTVGLWFLVLSKDDSRPPHRETPAESETPASSEESVVKESAALFTESFILGWL